MKRFESLPRAILIVLALLIFHSCKRRDDWTQRIANSTLREVELLLDSIYDKDQYYRHQLKPTRNTFGLNSRQVTQLWEIIDYTDSSNLTLVTAVLDQKGWLGIEEIGAIANEALFLVLQHADVSTQAIYLPMMRQAVEEGNARKNSLAMLEDRVAFRTNGKQIYGSQIGRDTFTGEYYVLPLVNPDSVNVRRARMNLGSIEGYVSRYNIDWNLSNYKKWHKERESE